MEVKDLIVPYNSNHSIKEAVIAIFLANRIIKPERFQKLIEHDFKDEFQQFDKIGNVAFRFQHTTGQPANITLPEKEEDAGFNFISYDKGEVNKILQARNENNRYFISFHDRKYVSWSDFYQSYIKYITVIAKEDSGIFVSAIGVNYLDQFKWVSDNKIDLKCIFKESEWLPSAFFANDTKMYLIQTLVSKETRAFINRIEITIDDANNITISHNIVTVINNTNINELLENSEFKNILDEEHSISKDFLLKILQDSLLKSINLK